VANGELLAFPPGSAFSSRAELHAAGLHGPIQAGIAGSAANGAESIVVSGGYEDDQDLGNEIIYTGQGGRDPNSGRQIADQELTRGNRALAVNKTQGLPVRVIRGARVSRFAPESGYRYDGLFRVDDYWHEVGRSGFRVWRFRLVAIDSEAAESNQPPILFLPPGAATPPRKLQITLRVVRDTAVTNAVKQLHDFRCQFCGIRLEGPAAPYAESAHIRPLGRPHNGPDTPENVLCLCPNHHVLFDLGAITIADDLSLIGAAGTVRTSKEHQVSLDHIRYHRARYSR
jgi:putative restriction endonuclease